MESNPWFALLLCIYHKRKFLKGQPSPKTQGIITLIRKTRNKGNAWTSEGIMQNSRSEDSLIALKWK